MSLGEAFPSDPKEWAEEVKPKLLAVSQGAHPKELIADWSDSLLDKVKGHSGLVDAYDTYDVLLNYWAESMQDDCYMISNDGWTYPEVKAIKHKETKDKKTNTIKVKEADCMYDELVCDLLPVPIVLSEYFTDEMSVIRDLILQIDSKQSAMSELVEQNIDVFSFDVDDEKDEKALNIKAADVKRLIKNAKLEGKGAADVKILKLWLSLSKEKGTLSTKLKKKRQELTVAVVKKYGELTEEEIKMLVVEKKWLTTIVGACETLMQSITHRIATEVTALAERYQNTMPKLQLDVANYEHEVNTYLKEMGFTL